MGSASPRPGRGGTDGVDLEKGAAWRAHLLLPSDLLPELRGLLPDGLHWPAAIEKVWSVGDGVRVGMERGPVRDLNQGGGRRDGVRVRLPLRCSFSFSFSLFFFLFEDGWRDGTVSDAARVPVCLYFA